MNAELKLTLQAITLTAMASVALAGLIAITALTSPMRLHMNKHRAPAVQVQGYSTQATVYSAVVALRSNH